MKLPNKFGSITKLKGNLRRPYMVRIYDGMQVNFETKKAYPRQRVLGYYATRSEAMKALSELTENDRLVGIISHVAELKRRIDQQIVVTKEKTGGSKVEIIV